MAKLLRLEIWDDVVSNSGLRQESVPVDEVIDIVEHLELNGEEYVEFSVNPLGAWDFTHGNVVRLVYDEAGADYDEYRIMTEDKSREQSGGLSRTIRAYSIKYDLSHTGKLLSWEQVNGLLLMHHELVDVTAEDMLDAIIATGVLPSYFSKGTVDNTTDAFTISWDWETVLSALEELATVTKLELSITRNGVTDYKINLLTQVGSTAETPHIRFAKNILSASIEVDSMTMGTLIYPKGEGPQGNAATIGDMRFRTRDVGGEPTAVYDLFAWNGAYGGAINQDFLVINEADQFNGLYIETRDNNLYEILDCTSIDSGKGIRATLDTAISIDNQVVHMREKATIDGEGGADLVYVPLPSAQALYDNRSMILERLDIPGVTNLVAEPFLENWFNSNHHTLEGTPTATVVNGPNERVHYGQSCVKVEADTAEGVKVNVGFWQQEVDEIVQPGRPHLSFQAWVYVEQGQVEFYLDFFDVADLETGEPVARWPLAGEVDSDGEDVSSAKSDLIDPAVEDKGNFFHLTLEPQKIDFDKGIRPTGGGVWLGDSIKLTLLATTDTTIFYVDAVQVVNESVIGQKIVAGSSASQLWDAAIRAFNDGVGEPKKTINIDTLDLERLDDATYPYDEIFPGVQVRVSDPGLDALLDGTFERRVFSVNRDLKHEALTQIELVDEDVA